MLKRALIGYTGFVGSNLLSQSNFTHLYNSKNIHEIEYQEFDEIWCAGVNAVKWIANKEPDTDWAGIEKLLKHLTNIKTKHFTLISTVDVYANPVKCTEDSIPETNNLHAYGKHRLLIEEFVKKNFSKHLIIRLPGLFGQGLKKNVIYDFLHNNELEKIHSESEFQFYSLDTIYHDIDLCTQAKLQLVHFATQAVKVKDIAAYAFNMNFNNITNSPPAQYDFQTKYADIFNAKNPYIQSTTQVLDKIKIFVNKEQK